MRARASYWEVPVDDRAPLANEWVVLCDSPTFSACLAGQELSNAPVAGEAHRASAFDAVWSVEPDVVRDVARAAVGIAASTVPQVFDATRARLGHPPTFGHDVMRTMTVLTNRIIAELDRTSTRRPTGARRPP